MQFTPPVVRSTYRLHCGSDVELVVTSLSSLDRYYPFYLRATASFSRLSLIAEQLTTPPRHLSSVARYCTRGPEAGEINTIVAKPAVEKKPNVPVKLVKEEEEER